MFFQLKEQATDILHNRKERRCHSLNRNFVGDYIGMEDNPALRSLMEKRERVEFAHTVDKYDRRFKVCTEKVGNITEERPSWSRLLNPSRPDPGRRGKINLNLYFHTSLWCLKRFSEGLHKIF